MRTTLFMILCCAGLQQADAQLMIRPGARLNIGSASFVTTSGSLSTNTSILGAGTVILKGTTMQQLNTNGNQVPNLTIQNPANIQLTGNTLVSSKLNFIAGKIFTGNFYLALGGTATSTGAGAGKFVETSGTGQLKKLITVPVSGYSLPVGNGVEYTPISISVSGTFSNASIGVNNKALAHPKRINGTTSYLNTYWTILRTGVSGTVSASASYTPSTVTGTETALKAYVWNGSSWSNSGAAIDYGTNLVSAPVVSSPSDIYAMNEVAALQNMPAAAGINRSMNENAEGLYPNPAGTGTMLYLSNEEQGFTHIQIYDSKGMLVFAKQLYLQQGPSQFPIGLHAYKNGVYQVVVSTATETRTFQLIKK